jgi:hypothetical protein
LPSGNTVAAGSGLNDSNVHLEADEDALVDLSLAVAEGRAGKQQAAELFRRMGR